MTKTIYKLIAGWLFLAMMIYELVQSGFIGIRSRLDTPFLFPISVFKLEYHPDGLKFAFLFVLIAYLALKWAPRLNVFWLWVAGTLLIVSANLAQGSFDKAFIGPFVNSGQQYFYDAVKILSGREWLAAFNNNQAQLTLHSRTHPPFAVLLQFFFLAAGGTQVSLLAIGLTLLSSLSIPFVAGVLASLAVPKTNRNLLTLLFALIPAVNIYSGVSLDGVILTTSLAFLYGLIRVLKQGLDLTGILSFAGGIILTNSLTFSGTFLLAVAGVIALRELLLLKKWNLMLLLGSTLLAGLLLGIVLKLFFHYDHLQAFLTAARLENPNGFLGWSDPVNYVLSRLEDVAEIALFLSVGCLAVLFLPEIRKSGLVNFKEKYLGLPSAGVAILALMLIAGVYRTGETGRACLFIYPYLLIWLRQINEANLTQLVFIAGAQTALMQVFGNFFW